MDSPHRSFAKAVSWQLIGLSTSTFVAAWITGDIGGGLRLAVALSGVGIVMYTLHERCWARVRWGRKVGVDPR